jgi:RNA polymerase sigma-70 factor (family 1)
MKSIMDEKELSHQIAQGDEAAFSILFYAYLGNLQPFILRLTRSAADTEEVIQETFMRLWLGRDKLAEVQSLRAWIFTVAANECYKYLKKRSSRENGVTGLDKADVVSGDDYSALDGLHLKEVKRLVAEAVGRLPEGRRRIYQMSRDEGMKIPEIAARLRISPNTVKNTLVVSLRFIRQFLVERGHEL